jgi:N-acetylglucosaminyldiphosphoundecaprenol N-acetyl-beta-D-mannosaminyltransferase
MLVTVNAATLVGMRRNSQLRQACLAASLIVPDGMSVVWASRLVGTPLTERVAGVDLMQRLLETASRERLAVYFLGSTQEVLDRLVLICRTHYRGLTIAGSHNGYFDKSEHARIIGEIRDSGTDILFVGMPSPFKEVWCHENQEALGAPVQIGVGGSFDVIAGFVSRAPLWMQAIGMEWFWRFLMEPRRLGKRYLIANTAFIWLVVGSIFRHRVWPRRDAR